MVSKKDTVRKEFFCSECSNYFDTYLRLNMSGNFVVECPGCGHRHYRSINGGIVTEKRHDDYDRDVVMGLKSSLRAKAKRPNRGLRLVKG